MTIKLCCFVVAAVGIAAAQVDVYTTPSSDSNNFYATSVLQVNMGASSFCQQFWSECSSATHTYSQTVTITSPSGRKGYCSFGPEQFSATTAVNLQCEASLSIYNSQGAADLGDWSIEDQPYANCSIAGTFLDPVIWLLEHLRLATTYMTNCYPTGSITCYCSATACTSGTPSCTGGWAVNPGPNCPRYVQVNFLVFDVPTLNTSLCSIGFAAPSLGGGPCS